tara:strand:- start:6781 stop:7344 length:564 start_codon:yes stop_codon:yes gene_type:complete
MQSPNSFLVKPLSGRRYDNIKTIGGIEFITSSSKEDHTASNRFAEVITTPIGYSGEISPGDLLLVHHNTFKFYNAMSGKERSSNAFLFDDLFLITPDKYYMYNHDGEWKCDGRSSFVRPVKSDNSFINKGTAKEPLNGEMVYPSDFALGSGLTSGDKLMFAPNSEYSFQVDGEELYRIYDTHLTIKL